jgi:hypothetical protein
MSWQWNNDGAGARRCHRARLIYQRCEIVHAARAVAKDDPQAEAAKPPFEAFDLSQPDD